MRISRRNPIFILVSIATFAVGVFLVPLKQPTGFDPNNVLVLLQSPWQMLRAFENQDLRGLDEPHKAMLQKAVEAITGKQNETVHGGQFEPALFRWLLNGKNEKRYILVEVANTRIIPGSSFLRIHVFDTAGHILNAQEFDTGNRTFVTSMRIGQYGEVERKLLFVEGGYVLTGYKFTQFYALTGDRMEQLYLQKDGRLDNKVPENNR